MSHIAYKKNNKWKLSLGKIVVFEPGNVIYELRDIITEGEVYFIIAGMVKMECPLTPARRLQYYLQPGSVFGLEETPEVETRTTRAVAIEKTMLFAWTRATFYRAADHSRPLAVTTIKSLSRLIRILNAEYGDYMHGNNPEETGSSRLGEIDLSIGHSFRVEPKQHQRLRRTFSDKQVLIKEGDVQKQVFWILAGQVYVTKKVAKKLKILTTLGKGELIGEMSFFDKSLASATVIAHGEVQVMVFSKKDFKEIFFKNHKWVKQLLFSLSLRITRMIRKFYKLESKSGI